MVTSLMEYIEFVANPVFGVRGNGAPGLATPIGLQVRGSWCSTPRRRHGCIPSGDASWAVRLLQCSARFDAALLASIAAAAARAEASIAVSEWW
jgi:hypothetical protein